MNENLSRYDSNALISTEDGKVGFLNTLSGTFSPLADSPVLTDIALSEENELFGVTFDRLYKINLNNGKSEVVGNLGSFGFNALDFASDGTLYTANGSSFYTIDTETGATTLIKDLGQDFVSSGDLVFDPARNHFWATSQGKDSNFLYEIDLEGKIVGEGKKIGLSDVYGLSLDALGTLFGYTADGQQVIINKETGASTYEQKIDGLSSEIYGATEYRPLSNVLFSDDFEEDLSKWTGKEGEKTSGVIVEDPIEGDRALSFNELNAGGDIFTLDPLQSSSGKYRLTFDYLGVEKSGSVPDDLGGFAGYSYSLTPDKIGNVVENWLAGTQDDYPKDPTVKDEALEVLLKDSGRWESVSIEFSEEQPIHLSFEDYRLSDGVPEDVYFDNIRLEALSSEEDTPEEPDYLKELAIRGTITGGNKGGNLLDGVDPYFRNVGFQEIKAPTSDEVEQTWVVIHGWNSSPDGENIAQLSNAIAQKAGENERVLALDWREAAENKLSASNPGGNGIAATWIASVAEFAVKALQDKYGIDSEKAAQSLNLVGHSLGSLVGSEIGRLYQKGQNRSEKDTIIDANDEGARTITALDPPSQENLLAQELGGGYDVDGRLANRQNPADFASVSQFSRSFVGEQSLAGNPSLADRADEAYELDFVGSLGPNFEEHTRVVQTFSNIIASDRPDDPSQGIDDLLGIDAYRSLDELPIEQFGESELNRGDGDRTYQGIVNVDRNNQPTLLSAKANKDVTGKDFNFLIGGAEQETIKSLTDNFIENERLFGDSNDNLIEGKIGEDTLVGSAGNDTLVSGYGLVGFNQDFLFGGKGADRLDGDGGEDTFVYQAGDGNTDLNKSDTIVNFGVNKDKIGLIDLQFEDLTFESRDRDAAIKSGDEYLALLKNVRVNALQNSDLFVTVGAEDFQVT
jgi:pimeloyl-ACP methyl ester carboxylesterase